MKFIQNNFIQKWGYISKLPFKLENMSFYNLYQKRIESLNKANKKGIFGGNPSNGHITSLNYNYNTNKIIKL